MSVRNWWTRFMQQQRGALPGQPMATAVRTRADHERDREDRRLLGMSAEDREWEQASQQRHRERQERPRSAEDTAEQ